MPPLRHILFFKFKADAAVTTIETIRKGFYALPSVIPNITFLSFMKHDPTVIPPGSVDRTQGYTWILDITFVDKQALAVYAPHPEHQKVVSMINEIRESVVAMDYELPDSDAYKANL